MLIAIDEELQEQFKAVKEKIDRYSTILIFLQKYTDLDAAGSSIGLLNLIKHNYKNKEIYLIGFDIKPNGINVPEEYLFDNDKHIVNDLDTLGISVDVAHDRQVKYKDLFKKCTEFVIIDHHQNHELWDQMKRKPLLVNCNNYGSCSGLIFKLAKHNEWQICKDVLSVLVRGHYGDARLITGIPGVWEIFHEIQTMGVDVSAETQDTNRHPFYMLQAFHDISHEAEKDGRCIMLTWTKQMASKYTYLQKSLFTFPLMFLHANVKADVIVYFHYLLRENPKQIGTKNIFIALIYEKPALEELLLANHFEKHRNWFYKRGDVMEFKELFYKNRELFTQQ